MPKTLQRRRFLRSLMTAGFALAAGRACPAIAGPSAGRVLYGFQPSANFASCANTVLRCMRPLYEPDLGGALLVVAGDSSGDAIKAAHRGPLDGGTVLLSPSSVMTLLPHLRTLTGVDAVADFVPVAAFCEFTLAFIVGPAVPPEVTTMAGYLAWVRANPMKATYSIPGTGTGTHLAGAELSRLSGVALRPVIYKSLAAQTADIGAGVEPAAITSLHNVRADFQHVRVLAVTSGQRWFSHPGVPTLIELGLAEVPIVESYGFYLPVGVPEAKHAELGDAIATALQDSDVRKALETAGMRWPWTTQANYADSIVQERAALLPVVQRHRFT